MTEQTLQRRVPAEAGEREAATATRRSGRRWDRVALLALLILLAMFFILPLVWTISTSLKAGSDPYTDLGWIPQNPTFGNFEAILGSSFPVANWFFRSIVSAAIGTTLVVLFTSMSGYAFARMDFPGKRILFTLLITTLLLPSVMFLVPQFLVVLNIGNIVPELGLASIPSYILPHLAGVFGVFFMRQFFSGIPVEIEEAAYVDGATRFRTFWSVVLPLAGPALATLGVITFLAVWNDYLWPLAVCTFDTDSCTLQAGLAQFQGQYTAEYGLLMAGTVIASVPVLIFYVFAQRFVVQSVASAGVKG
jgi:multiple sugar transport system permease protein